MNENEFISSGQKKGQKDWGDQKVKFKKKKVNVKVGYMIEKAALANVFEKEDKIENNVLKEIKKPNFGTRLGK